MSNSSTSTFADQKIAEAISAKAAQRREAFEQKAREAEVAKNEGNDFFKYGEYEKAIECYMEAMRLNFMEPNYFSNMAAAKIKVKQYEEAEEFAFLALSMDPCHMKARYRRLQARKVMEICDSLHVAEAKAMLRIEPNCSEAQVEIKELARLRRLRTPSWGSSDDEEDDWPDELEYNRPHFDPEDLTDSEDSDHTGNDVPCKYYNHDGCFRGMACAFSHAPDDLSERDRLGKNVCIFFLLGICKFGDAKCNYSHSRVALPPKGWWTDPEETAAMASQMKSLGRSGALKARLTKHPHHKLLPRVAQIKGGSGNGNGMGNKSKAPGSEGKYWGREKPLWYDEEEEMLERMNNCGFTEDDAEELISQGVKPWDDDAADVLAVLYDGY